MELPFIKAAFFYLFEKPYQCIPAEWPEALLCLIVYNPIILLFFRSRALL
jgi:hypothetical protein